MADTTPVSSGAAAAGDQNYDAVLKRLDQKQVDPRTAQHHAARTAAETMGAPSWVVGAIGGALSYLAQGAAVILDTITKSKVAGQPGIHDLIVAALGDVLQLDLNAADVPVGEGPAGQRAVNSALGQKFLDQLKVFFGASGTITGETAEQAAQAFLGFGMQFSASVGFLGLLGELFSFGHIKEVAEIGEMLERSLGLGRLTRQILRPYLRNLVEQPLDRKLRAQYRQDIMGAHQLAIAVLSGRMPADVALQHLAEHGLPDDQIKELIAQATPRIDDADADLLGALGKLPTDSAFVHLLSDGAPTQVVQARQAALAWKRTNHAREAILNETFSHIRDGFLSAGTMQVTCNQLGIPSDETQLWVARVNALQGIPRKRLSQADMLFLYEAAQITLDDVTSWAQDEGFSAVDQQRLQTFFLLKAAASGSSRTGGTAARAAHLHNEHIAFVTDEITGIFGRAPSQAELDHWVELLDTSQRTKADFKTELKALPTTGPAIPPGA